MKRALSVLIIISVILSSLFAYDPYAAAAGYPPSFHHPEIRYHHSTHSDLSSSIISSAFGIPRSDADCVMMLLNLSDEISARRGRLRDCAHDIISVLNSIYEDRRPFGREDEALRDVSSTLDSILRGRGSWQELERSAERSFPVIIRSLSRAYH